MSKNSKAFPGNMSASQITHFLKEFGGGNMNDGLRKIANDSREQGRKIGILQAFKAFYDDRIKKNL